MAELPRFRVVVLMRFKGGEVHPSPPLTIEGETFFAARAAYLMDRKTAKWVEPGDVELAERKVMAK